MPLSASVMSACPSPWPWRGNSNRLSASTLRRSGSPHCGMRRDVTGEVTEAALRETKLRLTDDPEALSEASFFIVTVPTPIDAERRPDLSPLQNACALIGPRLRRGSVVVFEFDRLSRPHPRGLRAAARQGLRSPAGHRLQARLFARTDQPGRQAASARDDRQDRRRRGRRNPGTRRRRLCAYHRGRDLHAPPRSRSPRRRRSSRTPSATSTSH